MTTKKHERVIRILTEHKEKLLEMNRSHIEDGVGIMDQIRWETCDKIDEAIKVLESVGKARD